MSEQIPQVIDISRWVGRVHHPSIRRAGVELIYAACTYGTHWADGTYGYHKELGEKAGLVVEGYHWFTPWLDPVAQAENFVHMRRGSRYPPAVDVEEGHGIGRTRAAENLHKCLAHVMFLSGQRPMVYTRATIFDPYYHDQRLDFSVFPLWVAHYTTLTSPRLPKAWPRAILWQYTNKGTVPGVRASVDFNRLSGTLDDLAAAALVG